MFGKSNQFFVASALYFVFFAIYVSRKLHFQEENLVALNLSLYLFLTLFICHAAFLFKGLILKGVEKEKFIVFALLWFFWSALFHDLNTFISVAARILLMWAVVVCVLSNSKDLLGSFTNSTVVLITLFVFLNTVGLFDGQTISNPNWMKNDAGFINPNIPGVLIVTSALMYTYLNKPKEFFLVGVILAALFSVGVFSRAALLSYALLIIVFLLRRRLAGHGAVLMGLCCACFFVQAAFVIYPELPIYLSKTILLQDLDIIMNGRLMHFEKQGIIKPLLFEMERHRSIDNTVYELIYYFGPLTILPFLGAYMSGLDREVNFLLLLSLLTMGFFEGFVYKVSPILLYLGYLSSHYLCWRSHCD